MMWKEINVKVNFREINVYIQMNTMIFERKWSCTFFLLIYYFIASYKFHLDFIGAKRFFRALN